MRAAFFALVGMALAATVTGCDLLQWEAAPATDDGASVLRAVPLATTVAYFGDVFAEAEHALMARAVETEPAPSF